MKKLKLSKLSKQELEQRQMKIVKGGDHTVLEALCWGSCSNMCSNFPTYTKRDNRRSVR